MKTPFSLHRVAFVALAIGIASAPAAFADTTATNSTTTAVTSATSVRHLVVLTDAERTELKTARHTVLAANPSLKTQRHELKQQFKALMANKATATPDQFKALHQQAKALHQQLRDAELKIDPNLAPIFAKLDAAKQARHHSS